MGDKKDETIPKPTKALIDVSPIIDYIDEQINEIRQYLGLKPKLSEAEKRKLRRLILKEP